MSNIEQKSRTDVRKVLVWAEHCDLPAVVMRSMISTWELRLWLNLYLRSVTLAKKVRLGPKVWQAVAVPDACPVSRATR
jgi:hypothetical protein